MQKNDYGFGGDEKVKKIDNEHYDEAIELKDEDDEEIVSGEEDEDQYQAGARAGQQAAQSAGFQDGKVPLPAGAYNTNDYSNLQVGAEVKQLFEYIARYKAPQMVLDAKLKPFIPDYVPAIGEVDAFIKMPRPDGQPETLGLVTLDEPALNQSKKAKLDLLMREYVKVANRGKNTTIHAIENADKNPKEITAWINDVAEIHKKKQPPSVSYSKIMPDIEELMQVWPQEIEDLFQNTQLPGDNIDMGLQEYCQFSCNLLDIPVHSINNNRNIIESLHVLFTLFSEFKTNQHFRQNNDEIQ
ncbi:unnamed protein product [Paramecium sonneborni]|uniref:Intraflagellar transport protein 46 homolog n=1 Tax=Paramecium sonneborni TaxID=65129 RepID=A0A8S1QFX7_9CILI|nr:unnamed protein product [Paramecium sonneborni]